MRFALLIALCSSGSLVAQHDSVLFQRAAGFLQSGRTDSALATFRLVVAFKDSPLRMDACLSIGRIYFESLNDVPQALRYYDTVYVEYFHQPGRAQAVFMLGYIYANALKDVRRAEGYYSEFLRTYPEHELVQSVRFEFDHLGQDIDAILNGDDHD